MPTTINAGFDRLRSNLEITGLQATTVSTRQQNARANLAKEMKVIDDFLTGSYMRNTMISPLREADVDIFVVLDPSYYKADGQAALLDQVRRALLKSYREETTISRNGQAVTIKLSDFAIDVVPGFRRQGGGYLIADAIAKRWIETDPKQHVAIWSQRNAQHNGNLIPLIKMIKGWNRKHSQLFRSFHLESLVLKIYSGTTFSSFANGISYFFARAQTDVAYTIADPAGYGANIGGYLLEKSKLEDVKARLKRAYDQAMEAELLARAGRIAGAYDKYRTIFGDYFPAFG